LGYVSGTPTWFAAQGRRSGFEERLNERGGTLVWVHEGDWSARSGHAVWPSLSQAERHVTGVAVANDSMAIGFISALEDDGVCVPDDISVIGTDDLPESRYLRPPLSTIALDFEEEGRVAVDRLVDLIEGTASGGAWSLRSPVTMARSSTRSLSD
jgi:DNA-binding LacI/PurR family transcriptional regulator